jgi:hypothetical protein
MQSVSYTKKKAQVVAVCCLGSVWWLENEDEWFLGISLEWWIAEKFYVVWKVLVIFW